VQKEVHNFFSGVVQDIIDYRQKNNVTRNDLLQKLINDYAEGKKGGLGIHLREVNIFKSKIFTTIT
jgi:hypothetical protein